MEYGRDGARSIGNEFLYPLAGNARKAPTAGGFLLLCPTDFRAVPRGGWAGVYGPRLVVARAFGPLDHERVHWSLLGFQLQSQLGRQGGLKRLPARVRRRN